MTRRFSTALIFLTLAAPSLFAQRTPPTPAQQIANRVARLTAILALTPAQQTEATTIFTTEQSAVSGMAASMKTARTALQTAIQANDTGGISSAATTIGSLTTEQLTAQATANAAFYAMLNPTQQAQYTKLGGLRGGGGLGGFGRGGGFARRGPFN